MNDQTKNDLSNSTEHLEAPEPLFKVDENSIEGPSSIEVPIESESSTSENDIDTDIDIDVSAGPSDQPVSYTHLTLPTKA